MMAKKNEENTSPKKKEETKKTKEDQAPAESEALQESLAQAQEELAQTKDRLLRTLAEFDNFKKRTVREKEDLYFAAKSDVVKNFLPLLDNFERAQKWKDAEDFSAGVTMILDQFAKALEKMGIRAIGAEGETFDPTLHEAIMREEKEGVEENTITEVLQKGYAVQDKVIRHAMVKVSG